MGRLVGENGADGEDGVSPRYMGRINSYTELEALTPGAKGGQFYITNDTGEGYFALAIDDPNVVTAWEFMGRLVGQDGAAGVNGVDGADGINGEDGISVRYMGRINSYADLEALTSGAKGGQFYITNDTGEGYFALAIDDPNVVTAWEFMGRLVGQDGAVGPQGETGATGPQGDQGIQGVQGDPGPAGAQGEAGPAGVDGVEGPEGPQGIPGLGLRFIARVPTIDDLPATANQGDVYLIEASGDAWVWDETVPAFVNAGPVVGPTGAQGPTGPQGEAGPAGAAGAEGPQGVVGPVGPKGDQGDAGPTVVSTDAGNASKLGTDGKIFTPAASGTSGLPTTGGTMTGTITLPTTVQSFLWGASTYNMFGANGGVAIRYGNANIVTFTATGSTFIQKITTPGTGQGVEFGSGGAYMSKVGTGIGVYCGGQQRWTFDSTKHKSLVPIELPADPVNALEAAPKQYVDTKPTIVSMPAGGTAPDAASYPNNTLLVEYV
jgi:hypothetical protein